MRSPGESRVPWEPWGAGLWPDPGAAAGKAPLASGSGAGGVSLDHGEFGYRSAHTQHPLGSFSWPLGCLGAPVPCSRPCCGLGVAALPAPTAQPGSVPDEPGRSVQLGEVLRSGWGVHGPGAFRERGPSRGAGARRGGGCGRGLGGLRGQVWGSLAVFPPRRALPAGAPGQALTRLRCRRGRAVPAEPSSCAAKTPAIYNPGCAAGEEPSPARRWAARPCPARGARLCQRGCPESRAGGLLASDRELPSVFPEGSILPRCCACVRVCCVGWAGPWREALCWPGLPWVGSCWCQHGG